LRRREDDCDQEVQARPIFTGHNAVYRPNPVEYSVRSPA
jgi:hypothetical protein